MSILQKYDCIPVSIQIVYDYSPHVLICEMLLLSFKLKQYVVDPVKNKVLTIGVLSLDDCFSIYSCQW